MSKGHCLCGATAWEYSGTESWACFYHCDDYRRNCSAPVVAFIGVALSDLKWTSNRPKAYSSSPGVARHWHLRLNVMQAKSMSIRRTCMTQMLSSLSFMFITAKNLNGCICRMICQSTPIPKLKG